MSIATGFANGSLSSVRSDIPSGLNLWGPVILRRFQGA